VLGVTIGLEEGVVEDLSVGGIIEVELSDGVTPIVGDPELVVSVGLTVVTGVGDFVLLPPSVVP
jgi:hypothetical protein